MTLEISADAEPAQSGDTAADHDPVNHPSHYTSHPSGIECIGVTRMLGFDLGNTVKYVWRRGDKGNPAQDLDKSLFYLDDAVNHLLDGRARAACGRIQRVGAALRAIWNPDAYLASAQLGLHVPPEAADLLLRVADHDPDPAAADFYRAVAAMDWISARDAVAQLRGELAA